MLIRRSAGGGICYIESTNIKSKAKSADNFRRNRTCCVPPVINYTAPPVPNCYTLPAVNGGSNPIYYINGGLPTGNNYCNVNAGHVFPCYSLPTLNGGPNPLYYVNGGTPLPNESCNINGGLVSPCYNLPTVNGGNPNSIPVYFITGSFTPTTCNINGGAV